MKLQLQWIALVLAGIALIAGSLGCATMAASSAANDHGDFYSRAVLSDEIIAIGKPDAAMSKAMGKEHVVAFLGKENTYLLYKGGEELESISRLSLNAKRLEIDAIRTRALYVKDKQVWGDLVLTYGEGEEISAAEQAELQKGGFSLVGLDRYKRYQRKVGIEGTISPAIKISDDKKSKLTMHRAFNLYHPGDAKPPMNVGATLMMPVAVAVDIVLTPVYLGVGLVVLVLVATH